MSESWSKILTQCHEDAFNVVSELIKSTSKDLAVSHEVATLIVAGRHKEAFLQHSKEKDFQELDWFRHLVLETKFNRAGV